MASAYMVVLLKVRNLDWIAEYVENVRPMIYSYGGDYVGVSSGPVGKFEGDLPAPDQLAIFKFPSLERLKSFMESKEYEPYAKLRKDNTSAEIFYFESEIGG